MIPPKAQLINEIAEIFEIAKQDRHILWDLWNWGAITEKSAKELLVTWHYKQRRGQIIREGRDIMGKVFYSEVRKDLADYYDLQDSIVLWWTEVRERRNKGY